MGLIRENDYLIHVKAVLFSLRNVMVIYIFAHMSNFFRQFFFLFMYVCVVKTSSIISVAKEMVYCQVCSSFQYFGTENLILIGTMNFIRFQLQHIFKIIFFCIESCRKYYSQDKVIVFQPFLNIRNKKRRIRKFALLSVIALNAQMEELQKTKMN